MIVLNNNSFKASFGYGFMVERKLKGSGMGIIVDKSKATKYYNLRETPFQRNSSLNKYNPYNSNSRRGIGILYNKRDLIGKLR